MDLKDIYGGRRKEGGRELLIGGGTEVAFITRARSPPLWIACVEMEMCAPRRCCPPSILGGGGGVGHMTIMGFPHV